MAGPSDFGFQNVILRRAEIQDGLHVKSPLTYANTSYYLFKYIIMSLSYAERGPEEGSPGGASRSKKAQPKPGQLL